MPSFSMAAQPAPPIPRFANPKAWPIVQGATDAVSATFVILHPKDIPFHAEALNSRRARQPLAVVNRMVLPGSSLATTEIVVGGLTPGIDFSLRLINGDGKVFDQRVFRSLDLGRHTCRFAVVSCMDDAYKNQAITMWEGLAAENCDFVVFLGDTCYTDKNNPGREEADYARRYAETRSTFAWFKLPRLIPSLAVWDDHDFGGNNLGMEFPRANFTRQLFKNFWGNTPNGNWRRAFGVGSVFEGFGQRFFLMDGRSWRAKARTGGMHWGPKQREWLLSELSNSRKPTWLMNGSQFFGGYLGKDSYEGNHNQDFKYLIGRLRKSAGPLAFVSGDVHFSETMTLEPKLLGYQTHEFTSSAMHSLTVPFQQYRGNNPRRIASEWRHNYLTFDVDVREGWKIRNRCVTQGNHLSYWRDLEITRG
jgi:hypothetical protein